MSKRVLEADIERVRAVVPLPLLELGPEILDKVLQLVARAAGSSPLLDLRLVHRLFAHAVKDVAVRELIEVLEQVGREYDAWQGRRVIPELVSGLINDYGERNQIRPMKVFLKYAPKVSVKGSEWFQGLNILIGIMDHGQVPPSASRETRVWAWLFAMEALSQQETNLAIRVNRDYNNRRNYIAWQVALTGYWPPHLVERLDVPKLYGFYARRQLDIMVYFEHYPLNRISVIAPVLKMVRAYINPQGLSMTQILEKRFPVVQDWCAWLVQHDIVEDGDMLLRELLVAVAELPRQDSDPKPQSIYEIVGPVAQIIDDEDNGIDDVANWIYLFRAGLHESLTAAELQTTLDTLGTMLAEYFCDESNGIAKCLHLLDAANALEVVRRVPPRVMEEWPMALAAFFLALVAHPDGIDPQTIWRLSYAANRNILVFDTHAIPWLHHVLVEIGMGDFTSMPRLEAVLQVSMPANRRVSYGQLFEVIDQELSMQNWRKEQALLVWLKYFLERPVPMDRLLMDLYHWFSMKPEESDEDEEEEEEEVEMTVEQFKSLTQLLVQANIDLQAAEQWLLSVPEDKREPAHEQMLDIVKAAQARVAAAPAPLTMLSKPAPFKTAKLKA